MTLACQLRNQVTDFALLVAQHANVKCLIVLDWHNDVLQAYQRFNLLVASFFHFRKEVGLFGLASRVGSPGFHSLISWKDTRNGYDVLLQQCSFSHNTSTITRLQTKIDPRNVTHQNKSSTFFSFFSTLSRLDNNHENLRFIFGMCGILNCSTSTLSLLWCCLLVICVRSSRSGKVATLHRWQL